jgi:hypothetical protein
MAPHFLIFSDDKISLLPCSAFATSERVISDEGNAYHFGSHAPRLQLAHQCCTTPLITFTHAGASHEQRIQVSAELARLCPTASDIANVTAEMTVPERLTLYQTVKQLCVTTRIIVVDLLTERLPLQQIAGLLILNAHRVTEQSGEGFAVRLLREGNKEAFVRGLSDAPGQLSQGLSSLERSMRALSQ